jgi:hypothetical protein
MGMSSTSKPAWQGEVTWKSREVWEYFVAVSRPGCEQVQIPFRVNRRKQKWVSVTDPREQGTGTAGATGIWGTLSAAPAGKGRTLTPAAFARELTLLIRDEDAKAIVEELRELAQPPQVGQHRR